VPENLDSALEGRDDDDLTCEVSSRVFFNGYLTKASIIMADDNQAITIDGTDYNLADLSENARNQVVNLRVTDAEIAKLNQQLAIYQTARTAYANALSAELPTQKKPAAKKRAAPKKKAAATS
tara:strand:+ start:7690 stop:8058 length:369 start_codon:yes stop_codon:yes gene_type:complete